jgi:hypothetical protein
MGDLTARGQHVATSERPDPAHPPHPAGMTHFLIGVKRRTWPHKRVLHGTISAAAWRR